MLNYLKTAKIYCDHFSGNCSVCRKIDDNLKAHNHLRLRDLL